MFSACVNCIRLFSYSGYTVEGPWLVYYPVRIYSIYCLSKMVPHKQMNILEMCALQDLACRLSNNRATAFM